MIIAMTIIICITLIIITFLYFVAKDGLDLVDLCDAVRRVERFQKKQEEIAEKMNQIGEEQYRQQFYDALKTYPIYGYDAEVHMMIRITRRNAGEYVPYIKLEDVKKCMGGDNHENVDNNVPDGKGQKSQIVH